VHEGVVLTEEDMYTRSHKNIERWIAAHMIPVRQSHAVYLNLTDIQPFGHQTYPIEFNSQTYPTLLGGTSVKFDVVEGDPNAPEWSNVLVNKDIRIVGSKEVRISFRYRPPTFG